MSRKLNLKNPTFDLIRVTAGAQVPMTRHASHFREKPSKYKAYNKMLKVVSSCKTMKQDIASDRMIKVFSDQYADYELSAKLHRLSMRNCSLPNV